MKPLKEKVSITLDEDIVQKIRELAEYCCSIEIDCDKCEHKELCDGLQYKLEDISPLGLIDLVDENTELD